MRLLMPAATPESQLRIPPGLQQMRLLSLLGAMGLMLPGYPHRLRRQRRYFPQVLRALRIHSPGQLSKLTIRA